MSLRRAGNYDVPDALDRSGLFEQLTDPHTGRPYPKLPCTGRGEWDEDAGDAAHVAALAGCATCPAVAPCLRRAVALGPLATGVWGGKIIERTPDEDAPISDATVAGWMRDAGITPRRSADAADLV